MALVRVTTISPTGSAIDREAAPFPLHTRQYARLLVLRGRVQDDVRATLELANDSAFGVQLAACPRDW